MKSRVTLLVALSLLVATSLCPVPACTRQGASALSQAEEGLAALLPGDGAVPGWKRAAAPVFYGPENLWDCINGAAALYLDYGFRLVVTAYYANADGSTAAGIEIYRMETPLHGFAIYAAERSQQDRFLEMGVEGYLGENVLNFWKGPYYTKVTSYRAGKGAEENLRKLASIVSDRIPGQYAEPEVLRYFPPADRVTRSERYIPKDFLGQPFFKGGYRVAYQAERSSYQLFLVPNASPGEAEEAFARYREHLESQAPGVALEKGEDYQTMTAANGTTAFQYGSYVGGVLGNTEGVDARKLVEQMVTNLKARKGERAKGKGVRGRGSGPTPRP